MGWTVPSKKVPVHQEHQNVTIFGERVFAGVTKVRMEMKSYWIKAGYKCKEGVLREERDVKTEAGTVVMHLQDREPQGVLETSRNWRKAWGSFALRVPKRNQPCQHSGLRNCDGIDFYCLKPPKMQPFLRTALGTVCLTTQLCPTLCDPVDCSPPGSSIHGDTLGKNPGVGSHFLFQGIFLTQGWNPGLPHCRQILYHLSYQGRPRQS